MRLPIFELLFDSVPVLGHISQLAKDCTLYLHEVFIALLCGRGRIPEAALPGIVVCISDFKGARITELEVFAMTICKSNISPLPVAIGDLVPPGGLVIPYGPAVGAQASFVQEDHTFAGPFDIAPLLDVHFFGPAMA